MCPETQVRLTSSKLEPDAELKRRVLAWLKVRSGHVSKLQPTRLNADQTTRACSVLDVSSPGTTQPTSQVQSWLTSCLLAYTYLQAKKDALQARASQPGTPTAPRSPTGGASSAESPAPSPRTDLNELIRQANDGLTDSEVQSAVAAGREGRSQAAEPAAAANGMARLNLYPPAAASSKPQHGGPAEPEQRASAAVPAASSAPRAMPSIFANRWAEHQQPQAAAEPDMAAAVQRAAQAAGSSPPGAARPSTPPAQQPPRPPTKSVFADKWGPPPEEERPPTPPARPPTPPASNKSVFADKWAAPAAEARLPTPPAASKSVFADKWEAPAGEAQPATQPAPTSSIFADRWASQGGAASAAAGPPASSPPPASSSAAAAQPQTSFVKFAAAAKKRAPLPPGSTATAGSPPGTAAAFPATTAGLAAAMASSTASVTSSNAVPQLPEARGPRRYAATNKAVQAVLPTSVPLSTSPPLSASQPLPASPPQQHHQRQQPWGPPVRSYSYFHEQHRNRHEQSLATVAAAQQRWGNQSKCVLLLVFRACLLVLMCCRKPLYIASQPYFLQLVCCASVNRFLKAPLLLLLQVPRVEPANKVAADAAP